MHASVGLLQSFAQNVVHIPRFQGFFEVFFTRWVDALTNENRFFPKNNRVRVGGYAGDVLLLQRLRLAVLCLLYQCLNICGSRATAAANGAHAKGNGFSHIGGKIRRGKVIDRLPFLNARKPRVRLEKNGDKCVLEVFLNYTHQFLRSLRAVDADGICSHALQHGDHCGRVRARHQLAVLAKGAGNEYGKIAILFCGKECGACLVAVAHGFDENEVCPMLNAEADSLGKNLDGVLKIKVSVGSEHSARGANVKGYPLWLCSLALGRSTTSVVDCRTHDCFKLVRTEFEAACPKGVGVDNV